MGFFPVEEFAVGDETRLDTVEDVVQAVGTVVCPVHDLALDAFAGVEFGDGRKGWGVVGVAEDELAEANLIIIEKMV